MSKARRCERYWTLKYVKENHYRKMRASIFFWREYLFYSGFPSIGKFWSGCCLNFHWPSIKFTAGCPLSSHSFWLFSCWLGQSLWSFERLFAENFSKNSNLDDSSISLHIFPSRTNLKLHTIFVTPKMVKNVIMNLDFQRHLVLIVFQRLF